MSDKMDTILKKLDSVESLQQQHGHLLTQLIEIVSATNATAYQVQSELSSRNERPHQGSRTKTPRN